MNENKRADAMRQHPAGRHRAPDPGRHRDERQDWRKFCAVVIVGTVILVGLMLAFPARSGAVSTDRQPYGGCKEAWQAPHSQGARDCRHHGWTVRRHFTIDPHNRLRATDFGPCKYEDSNGCYWNANKRGNGYGSSFVASVHGEVFYVAGW